MFRRPPRPEQLLREFRAFCGFFFFFFFPGLGFRVSGLGFRVSGLGFRV